MVPIDPYFPGDPTDPVQAKCEFDSETPPSVAILRTIAVLEDVDPRNIHQSLGITLNDHINPEALDQLVDTPDGTSGVSIELTIRQDRQYYVQIRDRNVKVFMSDQSKT